MNLRKHFLFCAFLACSAIASAQQSFTFDLYQGKPNVKGTDAKDTARVWVYLPEDEKNIGRAVLILPGGGYEWLSMDNEGHNFAPMLNEIGVAAIVLKYRMPHGRPQVPLSDVEAALRLIRNHAVQWKINPADVGVMGSSAGGHLAATAATLLKDDVRPNFQVLFYPLLTMITGETHKECRDTLLGTKAKKRDELLYTPLKQVSNKTPRAAIFFANDDPLVPAWNGSRYYSELYRHDVPASIFIYPAGGHGFGSSPFKYGAQRTDDLQSWLLSF